VFRDILYTITYAVRDATATRLGAYNTGMQYLPFAMIFRFLLVVLISGGFLLAQPAPASPATQNRVELPVVLQQKILAGKTEAGTAVRAKLEMATLVNGVVVPKGATLTGRVEESSKKSETTPSRLKIKFESATWKTGTVALSAYFTGCYYPINIASKADSDMVSDGGFHGSVGVGADGFPRPGAPPTGTDRGPTGMPPLDSGLSLPAPPPGVSSHWVRMDNVDVAKQDDGSLAVTSSKKDLKLDKNTTYLLETSTAAGPPEAH
jgi:hypothetical protein